MLAVREDFVLCREEGPATLDEIDARKPIFARDLLRAQVLFYGDRVVGAALHRRIVRDDDALTPADAPYSGDDSGAGNVSAVHAVRGKLGQLQERTAGVQQNPHALA